jgi:hypothetical protein
MSSPLIEMVEKGLCGFRGIGGFLGRTPVGVLAHAGTPLISSNICAKVIWVRDAG